MPALILTKIYLAGTVYTEAPDTQWKDLFVHLLTTDNDQKYYIHDPNPKKELDILKKGLINFDVVAFDKKVISNSDIVVAYMQRPSVGTIMEIMYAFNLQTVSVYVINPNERFKKDIWLNYHCHMMFDNVQDCVEQIKMIKSCQIHHFPTL